MYLIIFEDGKITKVDSINDGDKSAADDGYVDIIDISNPEAPKQYYNNEWLIIEKG